MLPYRDSWLARTIIVAFFLAVIVYAGYEARGIVFGPHITLTDPVSETHDPYVTIAGHADRIASLSMNGKDIPVTEDGSFQEPYLLAPGVNRVILDAKDRYGHTAQTVVQIVYTPDVSSLPNPSTATSSPSGTASTTPSTSSAASSTPVAPTR